MIDLSETQFQDFADEYQDTIDIPQQKGRQFLLCPIGIVGSGKTTVLKPLAEKLGLVRVSSDDIRKTLKEKGFSYKRTEDIAFSVADHFIDKGYGIAIDADCVRLDKKKQIEEISIKRAIPLVWIHINPPEEFILNKLRNYPHTWLYKDAEDAINNYEARKRLHRNLHFNFAYTFDTSKPDLNEQIDEAVTAIKKSIS